MPHVLLTLLFISTALLVNGYCGWWKHDLADPWVQRIFGGICSVGIVVLLGTEPVVSVLISTFTASLIVAVLLAGISMVIGHMTSYKNGPPVTLPLAVTTMGFSLFVILSIGIHYRFGPGGS